MTSEGREAVRTLLEELERPANRALRWLSDLLEFRIDWRSFGRTHGGFFTPAGYPAEYEPWENGRPSDRVVFRSRLLERLADGLDLAPEATDAPPRWEPWKLWYCRHPWRLTL